MGGDFETCPRAKSTLSIEIEGSISHAHVKRQIRGTGPGAAKERRFLSGRAELIIAVGAEKLSECDFIELYRINLDGERGKLWVRRQF